MIIFLRHGETVYNVEHRFQGRSDAPLTENGVRQAHKMAQFLSRYSPAHYFTSPLPRVQATLAIISADLPAPSEVIQDLAEISYGEWEGKTKTETEATPYWSNREHDRYRFVHPGEFDGYPGESYEQLYERLLPFFHNLDTVYAEGDIVVVAHQGVMVAVKKYYTKLSDDAVSKVRVPNNTVLCVHRENNNYTLTEVIL